MSTEEQPQQPQQPQEPEVPEDAIEVAQVQYAWLWSSWWLLAIVLVLFFVYEPIMPAILMVIILIPKYWQWRRTRYYLTEDALIYQRGGILQTRRFLIPLNRLKDTRARFGMFGRALGFQHVDIILENGALATLVYVPAQMDIADYFQKRMKGGGTSEDPPEEGAADEADPGEEKS